MPGRARAPLVSALALALMLVRAATSSAHAAELPSSQEQQALVVAVRDPEATQAFEARGDRVRAMVDRAITNLTGKPSVEAAWLSLVRTQDVVGIKVYSLPGPTVGTRPSVAAAVVEGLLAAAPPGRLSSGTARPPTCARPASSSWPGATASASRAAPTPVMMKARSLTTSPGRGGWFGATWNSA